MVSHPAGNLQSDEGKALRGQDDMGKFGLLIMDALGGNSPSDMAPDVRTPPCETKSVWNKMR